VEAEEETETHAFFERSRRLLREDPRGGYEDGFAPLLLEGLRPSVVSVLVAERAPSYLNLLYGLLLLRRGHELVPLYEDIAHFVAPSLAVLEPGVGPEQVAQDLDQLERWGCVSRRAEALKIRSYKDMRRQRFRYRLEPDAVALLEWLEGRLASRLEGRASDGRDLVTDIVGQLAELKRVLDRFRRGDGDADLPRRAMHLLASVDATCDALSEELTSFRAEMLGFVSQRYRLEHLRQILAWLERYLGVYLASLETQRESIAERLHTLSRPRYRDALASCHARLEAERVATPSMLRGSGRLREPDELLDAAEPYFAEEGTLRTLTRHIDDSARAVLHKMHRHQAELERRNARLEDLRAAITRVAALPKDGVEPGSSGLLRAVVASPHARFGGRSPRRSHAETPPLPRRHERVTSRSRRQPLRDKTLDVREVRALRARKLAELGRWVGQQILGDRSEVRLSGVEVHTTEAPRRMLDLARAWHLGQGRDLARMGFTMRDESGRAEVTSEGERLELPDAKLRRLP